MSDDPNNRLRQAVKARMEERGINTFVELAEAAGVLDPDTITNALDGKTQRPHPKTRAGVGRALSWPPDWLEYLRRGETPPDIGLTGEVDVVALKGATGRDTAAEEQSMRERGTAADIEKHRQFVGMLEDYLISRGRRLVTRQDLAVDRPIDVAWTDEHGRHVVAEAKTYLPPGPTLRRFADELVGRFEDIRDQAPGVCTVFVSEEWSDELAARLNRHHVIYATPDDNWARLEEQLATERGNS